ncbi:MAG: 16S rRNA (cytosine(1402)-N(4))-methyltransferase [Syntrophobacteraceae bacterium CG2_30_61_12]|nr:MAG: 16S rRNA (cytosine(1402)-N(4))-methyltransferase [Syntrophobacteraceae bacterium CG2_30_61_12]
MPQREGLDHVPVMLDEVMRLLACRAGGCYVDGTLGGGGYARAILRASGPDGRLLGLDWDAAAIDRVGHELRNFTDRISLSRASFDQVAPLIQNLGWGQVDGIVLDLGLSSFQLDDPERGFSFTQAGPLDMRMDRSRPLTAADLVNGWSDAELRRIIRDYGEERYAHRIAKAIVNRRRDQAFTTTTDLAGLIAQVVPASRDSRRIHPATRTFQALRIAVNAELEVLDRFLTEALPLLQSGGRLCVVAFHSLEDRLVKQQFKHWAKTCRCPRELPECRCEGHPLVRLLTRKVKRPSATEIERNPRARSARLRAVEKL